MDVSIIIVNYNTKELTKQCLQSVFEKTQDITFEVIVVDNASHDGSQQMLKEKFHNVTLIESNENLGFGRANNLGTKQAQGKYLFFLNSDTLLLNNAVKILVDFMEKNTKVGICGGNLFDAYKKPIHSYSMYLPSISWEINILFGSLPAKLKYGKNRMFNHTNLPIEVGYITGANLLIKSELFNQLNGFDKDFFMYYEETELTFRVKKSGYKVINIPQSKIMHLEGKSSNNNEIKAEMKNKSRTLYYKKSHSQFYILICNAIRFLYISRQMHLKL